MFKALIYRHETSLETQEEIPGQNIHYWRTEWIVGNWGGLEAVPLSRSTEAEPQVPLKLQRRVKQMEYCIVSFSFWVLPSAHSFVHLSA